MQLRAAPPRTPLPAGATPWLRQTDDMIWRIRPWLDAFEPAAPDLDALLLADHELRIWQLRLASEAPTRYRDRLQVSRRLDAVRDQIEAALTYVRVAVRSTGHC